MSFWANLKVKSKEYQNSENQKCASEKIETKSNSTEPMEETETNIESEVTKFLPKEKIRETPAQTKLSEEINQIKSQLLKLRSIESSGISTLNCHDEILKLDKNFKEKEKKLARLSKVARNMKKFRFKNRMAIKRLIKSRFNFYSAGKRL